MTAQSSVSVEMLLPIWRCSSCGVASWRARRRCPACGGWRVIAGTIAGAGVVHALTQTADKTFLVVEVEDGMRLLATADPAASPAIGEAVRLSVDEGIARVT